MEKKKSDGRIEEASGPLFFGLFNKAIYKISNIHVKKRPSFH